MRTPLFRVTMSRIQRPPHVWAVRYRHRRPCSACRFPTAPPHRQAFLSFIVPPSRLSSPRSADSQTSGGRLLGHAPSCGDPHDQSAGPRHRHQRGRRPDAATFCGTARPRSPLPAKPRRGATLSGTIPQHNVQHRIRNQPFELGALVRALIQVDLSRFCSGQVIMFSGLSFEGHGALSAHG